jgi:hypothetical protein
MGDGTLIDINLDDTPTELPPINEGVRLLHIDDIETKEKDDGGVYYNVCLSVNEPDAEDHERKGWERFDFQYPMARTQFKNLCLAAGHSGTGEGVDLTDLIGCDVKCIVAPRVYKDKTTGEQKQTTQVKKWLHGEAAANA